MSLEGRGHSRPGRRVVSPLLLRKEGCRSVHSRKEGSKQAHRCPAVPSASLGNTGLSVAYPNPEEQACAGLWGASK
jgi:hypothetical protein